MLNKKMTFNACALAALGILFSTPTFAEVLPEAEVVVKIPLTKQSITKAITIAYMPSHDTYYVADGGIGTVGTKISPCEIHAYKANGEYINSAAPGFNNRSIYFNPNTSNLETLTYNISAEAGFAPNIGIFSLKVGDKGDIQVSSDTVYQVNEAFGSAATIPSYDAENKIYYAKQERSNIVLVVDPEKNEPIKKIELDLEAAGALSNGIGNHFIGYTGVKGEELALLDIDHKAALIFNVDGKFIGKSALPKNIKLRANNHYYGFGYTNGLLFVNHEREGEFGTYYGFKVVK